MKKNLILASVILFSLTVNAYAQDVHFEKFFVANWNLENLYDVTDDPEKDDAEFLPEGDKNWTKERLDKKLENLGLVINSMNSGNGPDLLGVEEVENQQLLDTLISRHLKNKPYKIAYASSPDKRGVDVGLIYNSSLFELVDLKADTVFLPNGYPTRLVLMAAFKLDGGERIYMFVNHWPSRRQGEKESEGNRQSAASVVRKRVDEILSHGENAKIIIVGDFNDEPFNTSITGTLRAGTFECGVFDTLNSEKLYNLAAAKSLTKEGSYFYKGNYNMLDQIIISKGLLKYNYVCPSFEVFKPEFMKTRSGKFEGSAYPTFGGKNYLGGYSDHYPVTAVFSY